MYYGFIQPHFLYCLPIFSCTSQKNLKSLALLQKRCMRIISKAKYNAHTEKLFFNLKIIPFSDLIFMQNSLLMHSIEHKTAPPSFEGIFPKNVNLDRHEYALRNISAYFVPRHNNIFFKRFPQYYFLLLGMKYQLTSN